MVLIVARLLLYFVFAPCLVYGGDTLVANQYLSGNQTLVSRAGTFEMGFFRPGKSPNYYIGIWYNKARVTSETIVWVANRESPVSDKFSSRLKIVDGNLVLEDKSNNLIWSTNMISTAEISASLVLLDDGNLVLNYGSTSSQPVWQSFDHPTHTFLPGGKLGCNKRTNTSQVITSWRSTEDPGPGLYSLQIDSIEKQYVLKWNNSVRYWTSGSWDDRNKIFDLVPEMRLNYIYNFSYVDNDNESYFTYSLYTPEIISRLIIDTSGQIKQLSWLDDTQQWNLFWAQPRQVCEVYAKCGTFATCNENMLPFCSCVTAFEPTSQHDWDLSDYSGGCKRKTKLSCSAKKEKPGFILSYVSSRFLSSYPEIETLLSDDESACRSFCLVDCSCYAYTFVSKQCRRWNDESFNNVSLLLTSEDSNHQIFAINIKVSAKNASKITKVLVAGFFGLVLLFSIGVICYRRMKRRDHGMLSEEDRKDLDVPFFEFKRILSATENFSLANKLGQGGFGPVYKGLLPGGAEIAVKRLSSQSGQGLKEFKNEVGLIAKLQHRNLVRLLGYSMKDHEMILLYEYMPNKSLDRLIFDRSLCICLDWALRFDIIMGIARGLLYLHQDSRLRVIHRDLKASNVLLDEDMNPKISDFGLAKIVKGRDTEANTTRVIGTYGYMAPEYALDGLFSVKSDVFSFGVVVLEIISGKRNTGYYQNQQAFSLISYAWGLWKDKKALDLLDPALAESCNSIEVMRCMIVGLLCIQEDPQDRPFMTDVVLMLGTDIESLPDPKEPAFVSKKRIHSSPSYATESEIQQLTITEEQGR
ncbi:G-type lectin S-receptor-like serine/threonine-protein kinase [Tanacetum coccineum]